MSKPDRLEVTYRHGRSPDRTLMRVIVEGVDVGAVQRVTDSDGGWRPHRPDLTRAPARRPSRGGAAVDVLKQRPGVDANVAQRAVEGGLSPEERRELLIGLGVARPDDP